MQYKAFEAAKRYLERKGYLLLDEAVSSYALSDGDPEFIAQVDIVCESPDQKHVCFIEVYGRRDSMHRERKRLSAADMIRMSQLWGIHNPADMQGREERFDYILVTPAGGDRCLIQHFVNAYAVEEVLDCA